MSVANIFQLIWFYNFSVTRILFLPIASQAAFTYFKLTIEALKKIVQYVQS